MPDYINTLPQKSLTYCPFCGSDNTFFDEEGHFFKCRKCDFQLFINASAAVAVFIEDNNGKLLLTERSADPAKGKLDLPGGFVDVMETAEEAAIREIKEELNLDISNLQYITSHPNRYVYNGLLYYTLDLAYRCSVESFSVIQARDDIDSFHFLPTAEIELSDIGLDSIRVLVKEYLQSVTSPNKA